MRLSSPNLPVMVAMLLMLALGIGLGISIVDSTSATSAETDPRQPAAVLASIPLAGSAEKNIKSSVPVQRTGGAVRYVGVTFSRQSADIVARSVGRLEAVYVNLGDHLKPGAVIARNESYSIDQQLQIVQAALRSAEAEQRNAEVGLKDSEARYARRQVLADEGLISREELETARVQVEKAEAGLEVARAHVAEQFARIRDAQQSLDNTVVKASFAGTVAARYLDPGASVQPGTAIISLIRADDLWVRFAVPEARQAFISIGSPINFQPEGVLPMISGVIEYVSPAVAAMSQELLVEAKLKVPAALTGRTKSGGSGLVSVP
jgi:RND family efflux transporter MFP subunit